MDASTELRLLHDSWVAFWQTYITWFTWHFGIHMVVFGGVLTISRLRPHITFVVGLVLAFACLGFGASAAMLFYECEVLNRAKELQGTPASLAVFGGTLSWYAGIATFTTNLLLLGGWIYVFVRRHSLFQQNT